MNNSFERFLYSFEEFSHCFELYIIIITFFESYELLKNQSDL